MHANCNASRNMFKKVALALAGDRSKAARDGLWAGGTDTAGSTMPYPQSIAFLRL